VLAVRERTDPVPQASGIHVGLADPSFRLGEPALAHGEHERDVREVGSAAAVAVQMDHEVHGRQEREVRVGEGVQSIGTGDGAALDAATRSGGHALAVVAQGDRRDEKRDSSLGRDGEHV
jgi:hypothetical protein